ncbi:MBL fold metallo-hydrolase [Pseudoalteromonas rubra]|nr:MBL fold metallo-hydrolase [Pseudoalteromonas rubra]
MNSRVVKSVAGCALLLASLVGHASSLMLEHAGNAGVRVSSGEHSVLIDVLFGPHTFFTSLSNSEFDAMHSRSAAVAMATHQHDDHFTPARALRYLQRHPSTMMLGPPQVVEALNGQVDAERLHTRVLTAYQSQRYELNGVKVTMMHFPHMAPHADTVQNYAYLVEINGWTVLHVGDGELTDDIITELKLDEQRIDVALIYDLLVSRQPHYASLLSKLNAGQVVFLHIPPDNISSFAGWLTANLPTAAMLSPQHKTLRYEAKSAEKTVKNHK